MVCMKILKLNTYKNEIESRCGWVGEMPYIAKDPFSVPARRVKRNLQLYLTTCAGWYGGGHVMLELEQMSASRRFFLGV